MILSRRNALIGLSVATAATLAACTGSNGSSSSSGSGASAGSGELSGEITFQTWSLKNEKFTPYFEALIKDFQDQNPGTTINWIDQPGEGYEEKVLQQANSGELPDVINLPEGFAYKLAKVSQIVNLKTTDEALLADYVQGAVDAYTYDDVEGGTFGYPWYLGTDVCWWNTEMLATAGLDMANAPTDLDSYLEWCKTAAAKGIHLQAKMPTITDLKDYGADIFDGEKFTFANDKAAELLDKFVEIYKLGAAPAEILNDNYTGDAAMFTQEKVGYTTATGSFVTQLTNDAPNLLDKVDCSPRFTNPPLYIQGLSVSAGSKNPDLALAFAQFATNNANQVEFVKLAQGFMPGTVEGNENPDSFTGDVDSELMKKAMDLAAAAMPKAEITKPIGYSDDMQAYVQQQIALALKGDISSKEALEAAQTYCNNNLSE
ncbi:MAG: extracellular solute-binding protein [Actinomyces urogenitalis]|uniref:extracellular solute-binding protein n=1 Tax=Actinomyces urogenitalis TaxID=103621 RepID=UPI002A7F8C52|nr:extracellular solute-binding protein [Actinomyces urogenitalis]MDY3678348.1 extracellular solute-binding protein [Actinomyces urogenitalis]